MWITIQLVCVFINLLLRKTDGLSNDNIHITGPESFITDGSRRLTLTCLATDADQGTSYSWAPAQTICIDYVQSSGTCTLQPRLDQDGLRIICTAVASQGSPSQARYTLNLKYPPQTSPAITSSTADNFVFVGDTVTCNVEGGKPLVTAVHINCTHPQLTSTTSTTTSTSVSSSLIIGKTETLPGKLTCNCSATWDPEPGLYTNQAAFQIKDNPHIVNFTITGQTSVKFICEARGRPAPTLHISSGSDSVASGPETSPDNITSVLTYTLDTRTCKNGGTYTCTADNGNAGAASNISVVLDVNKCPSSAPAAVIGFRAVGGVVHLVLVVIIKLATMQ